ncbi:MAG: hypothetical protein JWM58_3662 [Rhizobium sp.]|nr:hypothetical protein [Rhizobium sp.]
MLRKISASAAVFPLAVVVFAIAVPLSLISGLTERMLGLEIWPKSLRANEAFYE